MPSATCVFCDLVQEKLAASIVLRDPATCVFLDDKPLFKGHALVVPNAHVETLHDLPAELLAPFFSTVQRTARAIQRGLGAQGTFIAMNNIVSQSVPHLHAHVVPRTKGDGLRGFFWPRQRYADVVERDAFAARISAALE